MKYCVTNLLPTRSLITFKKGTNTEMKDRTTLNIWLAQRDNPTKATSKEQCPLPKYNGGKDIKCFIDLFDRL